MIDEKQRELVEQADAFGKRLDELPQNISNIWKKMVGYIRVNYIMDEFWNGKSLKFRRGGKTLTSLSLSAERVNALVIFGKHERAVFEENPSAFSAMIQKYYDDSKTYHDGKWMFIDITDDIIADEVMALLRIKKLPNRKPPAKDCLISVCGFVCGTCLFNIHNIKKQDRREELTYGFAKCYGDSSDYRNASCPACVAGESQGLCSNCARECDKGPAHCSNCGDKSCARRFASTVDPGTCPPGLTAEEVETFVLTYYNR
ncbi:MAG: DUF3788 domain-containing protein [Oscillospiraceae bacterium]|nr:DUF3788 domain-containing protein [Oscillospiraceae bacterium]